MLYHVMSCDTTNFYGDSEKIQTIFITVYNMMHDDIMWRQFHVLYRGTCMKTKFMYGLKSRIWGTSKTHHMVTCGIVWWYLRYLRSEVPHEDITWQGNLRETPSPTKVTKVKQIAQAKKKEAKSGRRPKKNSGKSSSWHRIEFLTSAENRVPDIRESSFRHQPYYVAGGSSPQEVMPSCLMSSEINEHYTRGFLFPAEMTCSITSHDVTGRLVTHCEHRPRHRISCDVTRQYPTVSKKSIGLWNQGDRSCNDKEPLSTGKMKNFFTTKPNQLELSTMGSAKLRHIHWTHTKWIKWGLHGSVKISILSSQIWSNQHFSERCQSKAASTNIEPFKG